MENEFQYQPLIVAYQGCERIRDRVVKEEVED